MKIITVVLLSLLLIGCQSGPLDPLRRAMGKNIPPEPAVTETKVTKVVKPVKAKKTKKVAKLVEVETVEVETVKVKPVKIINANKKTKRTYAVNVPARSETVSQGLEINPFIVLFAGKSGKIAAYYRVDGQISFHGPAWNKKTFIMKCNDDARKCELSDEITIGFKPSSISFYTVDGCFVK